MSAPNTGNSERFDAWEQIALELASCPLEQAKMYHERFNGYEAAHLHKKGIKPELAWQYPAWLSGIEVAHMAEAGISSDEAKSYPKDANIIQLIEAKTIEKRTMELAFKLETLGDLADEITPINDGPSDTQEEIIRARPFESDTQKETILAAPLERRSRRRWWRIPAWISAAYENIASKFRRKKPKKIKMSFESRKIVFEPTIRHTERGPSRESLESVLKDKLGGQLKEKIGEGVHGVVYKYINGNVDVPKAIKIMQAKDFSKVNNEIKTLYKLSHDNELKRIAGLSWYADITVDGKEYWYVLMDYIEGKSLRDLIKEQTDDDGALPYKDIENYSLQLIGDLEILERNNICHGDLHLDNIRVRDDDQLFVIDFGTAERIHPRQHAYGLSHNLRFGPPSDYIHNPDIYCLGHIMFSMLSGKTLFDDTLDTPPENRLLIRETKDKDFYAKDGKISRHYASRINKYRNKHSQHLINAIMTCLSNEEVNLQDIRQMIRPA